MGGPFFEHVRTYIVCGPFTGRDMCSMTCAPASRHPAPQ